MCADEPLTFCHGQLCQLLLGSGIMQLIYLGKLQRSQSNSNKKQVNLSREIDVVPVFYPPETHILCVASENLWLEDKPFPFGEMFPARCHL